LYSSIPVVTTAEKGWKLDNNDILVLQQNDKGHWAKPTGVEWNRRDNKRGFPLSQVLRWEESMYQAVQVTVVTVLRSWYSLPYRSGLPQH
jgi:hypothetical protein